MIHTLLVLSKTFLLSTCTIACRIIPGGLLRKIKLIDSFWVTNEETAAKVYGLKSLLHCYLGANKFFRFAMRLVFPPMGHE